MTIRFMLVAVLALALPLSFSANAADHGTKRGAYDKAEMTGAEPDTDSCGLGWQVTKQKTLMGTCTRGTTNGFVPPTFGMTSGTIGCAKHEFSKNEQNAVNYASTNVDALSIDMAEGHGEYLTAFAQTLGCSGDAQAQFGHVMQANYDAITNGGNANGVQMYENVKHQVQVNPALASGCSVI